MYIVAVRIHTCWKKHRVCVKNLARAASHDTDPAFLGVRDGQTIGFLHDTSRGRERPDALLCRRRMAVDVIDPEYRFVDYIEIHRFGT